MQHTTPQVMAYFISFLKTLSIKLNKHTVHFFYNEVTSHFSLYPLHLNPPPMHYLPLHRSVSYLSYCFVRPQPTSSTTIFTAHHNNQHHRHNIITTPQQQTITLPELPPQHTNDFALYTEAIKFFDHSEGMVRIAVRTITLNVYKGACGCCRGAYRCCGYGGCGGCCGAC